MFILLHAFEEYGEECLQLFEGQFAFLIIDIKENRIFCARDRYLGINRVLDFAEDISRFASALFKPFF